MRRNATMLLASMLILGVISGCSLFKKKDEVAYDPSKDAVAQQDPYPVTYQPLPPGPAAPTGGSRTHVVAKGDTLYSLARQYYNDQSKWRKIYDANAAEISDPNRIRVGQRLVIP